MLEKCAKFYSGRVKLTKEFWRKTTIFKALIKSSNKHLFIYYLMVLNFENKNETVFSHFLIEFEKLGFDLSESYIYSLNNLGLLVLLNK